MRLSATEIAFIVWGGALGAGVGLAALNNLLPGSWATVFPPFALVLVGLGVTELVASLATGRAPGTFIAMSSRLLAFAIGVATLFLVYGKLA